MKIKNYGYDYQTIEVEYKQNRKTENSSIVIYNIIIERIMIPKFKKNKQKVKKGQKSSETRQNKTTSSNNSKQPFYMNKANIVANPLIMNVIPIDNLEDPLAFGITSPGVPEEEE